MIEDFWARFEFFFYYSEYKTLKEFCEASNIKPNTLSRQKAKNIIPKIEQISAMADALHLSLDCFLGLKDPTLEDKIIFFAHVIRKDPETMEELKKLGLDLSNTEE